jgi:hypothetical protein
MLGDRLGDRVTTAITSSMSAQTEAVIKNIIDALPKRKRHTTSSDSEADEEEDIVIRKAKKQRSSGRRSTGPRGSDNFFHVSNFLIIDVVSHNCGGIQSAFRTFLGSKGLLPSSREPLPPQVPADVLEAFSQDGQPTPDPENMQMDWAASLLTSPWNKLATGLLAQAFLVAVQAGEFPEVKYDAKTMNIASLTKYCVKKLARIHQRATFSRIASETIDENILREIEARPGRELVRSRRYSRRQNVCLSCLFFTHLITHSRCRLSNDGNR